MMGTIQVLPLGQSTSTEIFNSVPTVPLAVNSCSQSEAHNERRNNTNRNNTICG
jgi:hypothetical protein